MPFKCHLNLDQIDLPNIGMGRLASVALCALASACEFEWTTLAKLLSG